ncbi:MAG: hypothetical protein IJS62_09395, partial [Bacteroidales bacterium]|nr:hypothetical protein [Bacteroidales bacterium]
EILPKGREDATDKLLTAARYAGMTPKERNEYLQNMRNEFDIKTEKWYARQEGLEEGRAEGASSRTDEIARNMKADGLSLELVSKYTGLTPEQIQAL